MAEVHAAKALGRLALLNHQDSSPLGGMPEMVDLYYALGIRSALLAYNRKNELGDGCAERTDEGLTRLGRRIVARMLRVGMLVDGTHCGARTSFDMADLCAEAGRPFCFTHSNAPRGAPALPQRHQRADPRRGGDRGRDRRERAGRVSARC